MEWFGGLRDWRLATFSDGTLGLGVAKAEMNELNANAGQLDGLADRNVDFLADDPRYLKPVQGVANLLPKIGTHGCPAERCASPLR